MIRDRGGELTSTEAELSRRDAVVAELDVLRARLRGESAEVAEAGLTQTVLTQTAPTQQSGLEELARGFGLTAFERAVLLLAAGPELVAAVRRELLDATGEARITFGAALAHLPDAHWSAVTPHAPLRRWALVHLVDPDSPATSPLVADERILHHLVGIGQLDATVAGLGRPLNRAAALPPTLHAVADALAEHWRQDELVVLHGPQPGNQLFVAAAAAQRIGLAPLLLRSADLIRSSAGAASDRHALWRRLERETVLAGTCWVVDARAESTPDVRRLIAELIDLDAPAVVVADTDDGADLGDATTLHVPRLRGGERAAALTDALSRSGAGCRWTEDVPSASAVFDLPLDAMAAVARDVAVGHPLWTACRSRSRASFGGLAQIRTPHAGWDDLVLPDGPLRQLHGLAAAVRHRHLVLDDWGFAERSNRGLGTSALFAGPSGTGKTLAAEVLAKDLDLDLVHVDLSQVVSKYIGESEKHLRRLFDAAEGGGAVLLFDEADVLFGKRSEVHDSHDRYANLEVGYLLQRMEEFRGLAILTTNARSSLDAAFSRRLSAIITFPYPDEVLREQLWRHAFPAQTPTAIDPPALARIDLPGGGIAAAALTAAYLAAADGEPVNGRHVHDAARWELAKSGRTLPVGAAARTRA